MFRFLLVSTSLEERRRAEQKGKHLFLLLKFVQIGVYSWLTFFVFFSSGKAGFFKKPK
jgi:hypothetical protein